MQALALTPADLRAFDGEPRVHDLRLAEVLGFSQIYDIRKLIKRNLERLGSYGLILATVAKIKPTEDNPRGAGRSTTEYHLNERQAYRLCMWSDAPNANVIQEQMVEVFFAYRHGQLVPAEAAEERRLADPWAAMEHRIAQLERLVSLQALTGTPDFAKALTDAEGLFPLRDDNGKLHSQHRFRWWGDLEVREQVIALHRQCTIHKAVALISENMGRDRAPSKSSVGRFWKAYDLVKRIH